MWSPKSSKAVWQYPNTGLRIGFSPSLTQVETNLNSVRGGTLELTFQAGHQRTRSHWALGLENTSLPPLIWIHPGSEVSTLTYSNHLTCWSEYRRVYHSFKHAESLIQWRLRSCDIDLKMYTVSPPQVKQKAVRLKCMWQMWYHTSFSTNKGKSACNRPKILHYLPHELFYQIIILEQGSLN